MKHVLPIPDPSGRLGLSQKLAYPDIRVWWRTWVRQGRLVDMALTGAMDAAMSPRTGGGRTHVCLQWGIFERVDQHGIWGLESETRETLTACNAIPSAARPSSCKHRDVAIERAARCLGDSIRCGDPLLMPRKQYDDDTHRMPQLSLTTPTTKAQQVSPTSPV